MSIDGASVLVVDDDDKLRGQLGRAFASRGFSVRTAATVEEAIELAAEESPELAVVDLRIGRDNGLVAVRDLLRIDAATRIVVLTAYGSIATAVKALQLGAIDYLTKPADLDDLVAAFEQDRTPLPSSGEAHATPSLAQVEWEHIQRVLADCDGNVTRAAEVLGIHRRSLQRKLRRAPE